ncbi:hypothetical protein P879_00837 [Paragonimus westermani]|uniref:Ig-like domain-containing protein n=1 Tax=Paragonimus westermani TaxID=34504 RepID=A0A8T0DX46_9TREM|nr:hypothetical protein P879_00837 [Paragonimus westermani]
MSLILLSFSIQRTCGILNVSTGSHEDASLRSSNNMLQDYQQHIIPHNSMANPNSTHNPLLVDVNLFVYSFSSISVVDMDYTIDFMLRQRWLDERLKSIAPRKELKLKPITYMKNRLWLPDLFFRNAKSGFLHQITQPNYLLWLDSNSVITFSQKISMKLSCHMSLWNFPMDTQPCKLNIGSYGYAKEDLEFRWRKSNVYKAVDGASMNASSWSAIEIRPGLEINEFTLISHDAYYCAAEYSSTGKFSCLEVEFRLRRRFGFYLIYAYLPSMLIVIIAWVSFLLDPSAVPARVSIGLLCVLALITQSAAILTQLPRVSYVKAMDIWVFVCLAFVVSSLLEFAAANTLARKSELSKATKFLRPNALDRDKPSIINVGTSKESTDLFKYDKSESKPTIKGAGKQSSKSETEQNDEFSVKLPAPNTSVRSERVENACQVHQLDMLFALAYPALFLVFNVAYWFYYLIYAS